MLALTIGGQAGAGGPEVGSLISKALGAKYVEQLALRRLARNLGATAEAVTRKELSFCSRKDRITQKLELFFTCHWERADPSMGWGWSPPMEYLDELNDPIKRRPAEISTDDYVDAIHETADQFIREAEDIVLVKRAGCVTLKGLPQVFHVGLFARKDFRVAKVANRLSIGTGEAEEVVTGLERARSAWFGKIADADPMDHNLYSESFYLGPNLDDHGVARYVTNQLTKDKPVMPSDGSEMLMNP